MTVETVEKEDIDPQEVYSDVASELEVSGDTPRSVHTSVDAKIAYLPKSDEFGVVVTETNAFPEGQEACEGIHEEAWIENTVNALTNAIPEGASDVVVNLPKQAYVDDIGWLIDEKEELKSRIEDRENSIATTKGGDNLQVSRDSVEFEGSEYDFVVNLSDLGDDLEQSTEASDANQNIVNAPTGVWNTNYSETGKAGLHESVQRIVDETGSENVFVPENYEVFDIEECVDAVDDFFQTDSSAILKGNFGTHGDEVVHLDYEEFETLSARFGINTSDYVKHKVNEVEGRVKDKPSVDPNYSLFDENGGFNGRGESSTAVLEQAVDGRVDLDGEQAEILDYEGRPVDLVYTVWDAGDEYQVGLTVRASNQDDTINANCGSHNFDLVAYDDALNDGLYQGGGGESLENLLNDLAGREVDPESLKDLAGEIAQASIGGRNLSAYRAEKG